MAGQENWVVVEQLIAAGSQFGGVQPAGASLVAVGGLKRFAASPAGGLFEFPWRQAFWLYQIDRIELSLADAASYSLGIQNVDGGGPHVTALNFGALVGGVLVVRAPNLPLILHTGERLVLTTAAATLAMSARVVARPLYNAPPASIG